MRIGAPASVVSFLSAALFACGFQQAQPTPTIDFLYPPPTFTEADLIGTWQHLGGGGEVETVTLMPDGTVQQVFTAPGYSYTSGPNKWWVEYRPSGCIYVHLEGMRYYGGTLEEAESGGLDPMGQPYEYLDLCENRRIQMVNNVILRVEHNPNLARSIMLVGMMAHLEGGSDFFLPVSTPAPSATSSTTP